jgi:hypothetical protein
MIKAVLLNKAATPGDVTLSCVVNLICPVDFDPCWTDDPCPSYVNPCTTDCGGSGGVNRVPLK